jgi:hypothetical protein
MEARRALEPRADRHLQSTRMVAGYHIHAVDGTIGHVTGFHVNAKSWAIHDLVVETGHWFSGKQILISPSKVEKVSYVDSKVWVKLSMAVIRHTAEDELVASPSRG